MSKALIESILFISEKPLSVSLLSKWSNMPQEQVQEILDQLQKEYKDRGFILACIDTQYQFRTHPDFSQIISSFTKDEVTAQLTKPSLETLSIIAYKGPLSKEELEYIRGVNCSMILRNLLIRGLIERGEKDQQTRYKITFDFLKYLGISDVKELPHYDELRHDQQVQTLVDQISSQK